MMSGRRLKTLALLVLFLAVQVSLFAHIRPFGVAPDVLVTAALVGGIVGGPDFGAKNGFAAGLIFDLVLPGAFGLAAGVYGVFGYGVALIAQSLDPEDPRVLFTLVGVFSFLATSAYGLGLGVLGSEQFVTWRLLGVSYGVAIFSTMMAGMVRVGYAWALADPLAGPRTEPARAVVN